MSQLKKTINILQEFSLPLIAGVIVALVVANANPVLYDELIKFPIYGPQDGAHPINALFLINDVFMVFFFGIAAKEITESCLPGGDLNPPSKAINPLLGTIGGVLGPVAVYFLMAQLLYTGAELTAVRNGWGIPTATDIALAWLVARMIFGNRHPAVNFLLLLAVADDAIGLIIIAVFYGNPELPAAPIYLLYYTVPGMVIAYVLRRKNVQAWLPYILFGGTLSWFGFISAHLHPALALVPIVPFLPGPTRDTGMFEAEDETDQEHAAGHHHHDHSPLHNFEHNLKLPVDLGLFFFAFANAGVQFASVNAVTWIILASLIVGKVIGISFFSGLGAKVGFPLPEGMGMKHLVVAATVAGLGLTVALFVAGQAFPDSSPYNGPAKMGAVLSAFAALVAIVLAKVLGIKPLKDAA
ncbi:MAG: Na+/H+ antiporter NhaA [Myxococcota bacterium]|nr:Na+/H+ antiporter NhaA [Myxococcota bacterium]MEC9390483.1 Na+/H+ antiporter NhaA [Myxococcota bacterium]